MVLKPADELFFVVCLIDTNCRLSLALQAVICLCEGFLVLFSLGTLCRFVALLITVMHLFEAFYLIMGDCANSIDMISNVAFHR